MENSNPKKDLLNHSFSLRYKTCDLKSKLTALVLYVEDCDELDEDKRQEILRLCNTIAEKNNDLITSECKLIETVGGLLSGTDTYNQDSMLVEVA